MVPTSPEVHSMKLLYLSVALVLFCVFPAFAQQKGKGPAYDSPPAEDANYPLMGEFVGK